MAAHKIPESSDTKIDEVLLFAQVTHSDKKRDFIARGQSTRDWCLVNAAIEIVKFVFSNILTTTT